MIATKLNVEEAKKILDILKSNGLASLEIKNGEVNYLFPMTKRTKENIFKIDIITKTIEKYIENPSLDIYISYDENANWFTSKTNNTSSISFKEEKEKYEEVKPVKKRKYRKGGIKTNTQKQ
ncbi:MAG: hypothetical protein N2043_01795 [Ignavibacterium sp.]|nr:hypothetical protein [Ignavibacterium sp.]